ncbi:odorant receptor 42a-like [Pieris rapae]|uniref:odorant receptor 42a-like n=1 Tax=Pieris rapae TaxID=64459 RepID=UPI001E27DC19|nr:odorant receptor 42a-like [Pieris rapae]
MANISDTFNINFICLKVFGVPWPGKTSSIYYKCYSSIYILVSLILYYLLIILNLFYTPRNIELLVREVLFCFSETVAAAKVVLIFLKRKTIVRAFRILNCTFFKGDDESQELVSKYIVKYKTYWKLNAIMSNSAFFAKIFVPIMSYIVYGKLELPIYNYYFLEKKTISRHFTFLWFYQAWGIYGHMMYNINIDSFIAGLILIIIAQIRIIDHDLRMLKSTSVDEEQLAKLNKCLRHYEMVLQFSKEVQSIISVTMFIQFSVASGSICAILCSLLFPTTFGALMSMLLYMSPYAFVMILQIFVPAYLGTQLRYRSQDLVHAAYSSKWIARSESFKRSLKLFMLRANTPIVFSGCGLFPLTLVTFTSIMKTAYSFFTVVRNVQRTEK